MLAKSSVPFHSVASTDDKLSGSSLDEVQRVASVGHGPYRDRTDERLSLDLARELAMAHLREAQALRTALERVGARRPLAALLVGVVSGAALTTTVAVVCLAPIGDAEDRAQTRGLLDLRRASTEQVAALAELEERLAAVERREVAEPRESPPPSPAPLSEPEGLEVISLAQNEYLVSRSFLVGGLGEHSSARLLPHEVDGITLGVRVFGLRQDSRPARLGIQNGATVVSVNGISIAEPNSALSAYTAVRESTSAELVLLRRGRRVLLRYTILG